MRKFFALLRIQLLARYADLKPGNLKKITDKKERKKKRGTLIAYLVAAVMFAGMIIPYEYFLLGALHQVGMADMLPALAVTLSMLCTLVMGFFFIMSSLYFGKDAAYLAALPIKSSTVLSAKLTQVWLSETLISALFVVPASVLYGIRVGVDALFWGRMVLVWLTVSVLPICIVTLLSALLIRLSSLWKHREAMMTVGGMALMAAYFIVVFSMNTSSMESMESMESMGQLLLDNKPMLQKATSLFPPAMWAAQGLLGDWGKLALSLVLNAAAAVFTVCLMAKPYRRLSLLQTQTPETRKELKGDGHFVPSTPFMACVKRELRQLTRVSAYALNTFPTALMPALFVGMMAFAIMQEEAGEGLQQILSAMGLPGGVVTAFMVGMMCFMAGINPAVATAVSREGRSSHGMLTSLPVSPRVYARAKLAVGMGLSVLGIGVATVLGCVLVPAFLPDMLAAFAISILYCLTSACLSLCVDIKNPRLDWMTETEAIKQGSSTWKSMLIGLAVLLVLVAASVGLFLLGAGFGVYVLAMVSLLAVAAVLSWRGLMRTADKYYWQG